MNFGQAIEALKQGNRVQRAGWNGKGMWLALTHGSTIHVSEARSGAALAKATHEAGEHIVIGSHIDMRAADGSLVIGWLASQTDMLSDDWQVVE
jgi:hypothetical protein